MPLALAVCAAVLIGFHDRFWYPPDDGAYAHVASRILDGELLNRDVQDVHLGTINFANAAALWLFGNDLISLRYPLILLGILACALTCRTLRHRGPFTVLTGGFVIAALSIVQFLNPTAHWYCFALFWITIDWLSRTNDHSERSVWANGRRLLVTGLLVGLVFQFRQLSGVLLAMGVLTCLIAEASAGSDRCRSLLARALCLLMFVGLSTYLLRKTDPVAMLLYGSCPLLILASVTRQAAVSERAMLAMLGWLVAGGILSLIPLTAFHLASGSISVWLADTVFVAESLTQLDFFRQISFPRLLTESGFALTHPTSLQDVVNALFWIGLLTVPPLTGYVALRQTQHRGEWSWLLIPVAFYSVVSLHFQIPVYLFYTVSISLVALIAAAPDRHASAINSAAWGLCIAGLVFHAGQPAERDLQGILAGETRIQEPANLPQVSLKITPESAAQYRQLLALIDRYVPPDGTLLALPVNPELYVLSGRKNPTRFFNSALGLRTTDDVTELTRLIHRSPPQLVFFRPQDKYVTPALEEIMREIRACSTRLPDIGDFEIYRPVPPATAHAAVNRRM